MIYWYVGPWEFRAGRALQAWYGPSGMLAGLDFRSDSLFNSPGLGVFACDSPVADSNFELIGAGDWSEIKPNARAKEVLPKLGKRQLQGETLLDLLADTLMEGADPTGQEFIKPIMPSNLLRCELQTAGLSMSRLYLPDGVYASHVRDVIKADIARVYDVNPEIARKLLDFERQKYRLGDDWQQLVPNDLIGTLTPGKHETTITDNFNRANSANLGSSSEGWSWTEFGQLDLVTNAVQAAATSVIGDARADSSLSGADHYAQIDIIASSVSGADGAWSPLVRFDAGARTYYSGEVYEGVGADDGYLLKTVAGTRTVLAGPTTVTNSVPQSWRLTINGSSLVLSQAGVDRLSVTDTAITGNLRTGIFAFAAGTNAAAIRIDNFVAADLSVPPTSTPLLSLLGVGI